MCMDAAAQNATTKAPRRWGGAVQFEVAAGGDDMHDVLGQEPNVTLGQGVTISGGLYLRPFEHSNTELQVLAGFKAGEPLPVVVGPYSDVSRWVFQFLADYRTNDKWYWGGGLVLHTNPKFSGDDQFYPPVHFDDAVGAVVEGGWNWVGLQCTYITYHNADYGTFDASNCGLRFTLHFHRWHPVQ